MMPFVGVVQRPSPRSGNSADRRTLSTACQGPNRSPTGSSNAYTFGCPHVLFMAQIPRAGSTIGTVPNHGSRRYGLAEQQSYREYTA